MTNTRTFLDGRCILHCGDSRDVLKSLPDCSIDSVVTDPPYGLGFMGRAWDAKDGAPFAKELWAEVFRVLKPGGHVAAFSGTRTYHRMAVAIEDAGFEIRDQIGWAYATGFPKSHNIGNGFGTALKPAWEPICLARKPLIGTVAANVQEHGTGALNIDGCRVGTVDDTQRPCNGISALGQSAGWNECNIKSGLHGGHAAGRWPANIIHDGSDEVTALFPDSNGQQGDVTGYEPSDRTSGVYGKMKREGEASANRRYTENGGTNFAALPGARRGDSGSAARFFATFPFEKEARCDLCGVTTNSERSEGAASTNSDQRRLLYSSKANGDDRLGSKHPTVKPIDLMQWLCRLITPPGGTVLDPFAGTGTTGEAAWREGMNAVLIEREDEYQDDIARRMELAENPTKRAAVAKTKNKLDNPNDLPLFSHKEAAE